MFKNESSILKSWFDHYINEGVDHFYILDNGSEDNYMDVIKPYMEKITLLKNNLTQKDFKKLNFPIDFGKQDYLLDMSFVDVVKKETEYIFVCDIDEYLYTKTSFTTLKTFLKSNPIEYGINIRWKLFGVISKTIPINLKDINVRQELVCKNTNNCNGKGYTKCLSNTKKLDKILVHESLFDDNYNTQIMSFEHELQLNHYKLISEDYFKNVKSERGGGSSGMVYPYTMDYFYKELEKSCKCIDDELKLKEYV